MSNFARRLRRQLRLGALLAALLPMLGAAAQTERPIVVGLTAEFGMPGSHAAQSIEKGILLAIDEINAQGGVLGRKLALEKRDDRGVPARGIDNFIELSTLPDVVAVFCGRFSPVALEIAPVANRLGTLLLDPWAAANGIVQQPSPNFVFRLSLTDTWAMEALLAHASGRRLTNIALFLPNTAWGRSSEAAAIAYGMVHPNLRQTSYWYNWGDTEFSTRLSQARAQGAKALVMVANEAEGSLIVKQMAALPANQRLPIISHWGIAGGDFAKMTGDALKAVDLVVVQTFTFNGARSAKAKAVADSFRSKFGHDIVTLRGQVGFAHAYDLTYLLAAAIRKAGRSERAAVRTALERLESHDGLVRRYRRPFGASDHEALDPKQLFMARFDADGNLRALAQD